MSAIGLFYTSEGIMAITGKEAVDAGIFRLRDSLASGETFGVAADLSNKAAPIVNTWNDAALMKELMAAVGRADWNEYTKESFAAVLGTLAGVVTLPAGPITSLAADMLMSKVCKETHDAASSCSRSLNWDPMFDRIHNNVDYLNRIFGAVDYDPAGVPDRIPSVGVVQFADSPAVEMPHASGAEKFTLVVPSSNHAVTLTSGDTLSDITVSDVLTTSPKYTDVTKIPAGAELNVPVRSGDKLSIYRDDGSVETINTRTTEVTPSTQASGSHRLRRICSSPKPGTRRPALGLPDWTQRHQRMGSLALVESGAGIPVNLN